MDEKRRSTASADVPNDQLAPILRAILQHNDQIVEQNQAILQLLNYHIEALPADGKNAASKTGKDIIRSSSQRTAVASQRAEIISLAESQRNEVPPIPARFIELPDANAVPSMWEAILKDGSHQSPEFDREYHRWRRPWTIQEAFLGRQEWTSRSYQWAFPELVRLLRNEDAAKKCHAQVVVTDFADGASDRIVSAYNEARPRVGLLRGTRVPSKLADGSRRRVRGVNAEDPFACNLLWQMLEGCACNAGGTSVSARTADDKSHRHCIRGVNIMDISARALTCLLASTPRVDLSYMAAFVQRHLASSNWGKATPLRYGEHMSSYTLEYHFSCYYVTSNLFEPSTVKPDLRRLRKSARFGIGQALRSKYIHEENLSFLLVGHFRDVSTCVQLAESYFKYDPYRVQSAEPAESSSFRPLQPDEPAAALFLSWISVALHHVLWRWQSAIEAVQAEIKTSRHIVFMDDRNDLMADDPSFSLSKTYFWALQVYKLFDDTISESIAAWERFSDQSLPQLQDPRITDNDWQRNVRDIDDAVDELRKKITKIRTMTDEVKELRRGLISASALFDSRTSVRQGENIRLLTYITLLFLPLSFATSIFGMQFMGSSNGFIYAFASVLPAVTVLTALFVFNMENIITLWERSGDAMGGWLRRAMSRNNRGVWHGRAIALEQDLAASRAPVRKAQRETTAWTYLAFIFESVLVEIPVSELAKAVSFIRSLSNEKDHGGRTAADQGGDDDMKSIDPTVLEKINESVAKEREREREERREQIGSALLTLEDMWRDAPRALRWAFSFVINVARAMLVPIWVAVILVEYVLLTVYVSLVPSTKTSLGVSHLMGPKAESSGTPVEPWRASFYVLGLQTVFPQKISDGANTPGNRESQTFRHLSRAATQLTLMSEKSANTMDTPVDVVSPLPKSGPQVSRSAAPRTSSNGDSRKTSLSNQSLRNKDPSRHTMEFIEDMSRTSTPVPMPTSMLPRSPPPNKTRFMGSGPLPQSRYGPPTQPGPRPPAPHSTPVYTPEPRSPTVETDFGSRPDTATTDGLPIPELTARVQSMQRMSVKTVGSQGDVTAVPTEGNALQKQGMRISGNMEQRPTLNVPDGMSARKSEVGEVESSSRPPTPPAKEGVKRSRAGNPDEHPDDSS